MVSVRTVLVFVVTLSYLDSVLSFRDRELRTSSWCPEVGLGILLIRLRCPEVELGISLFKLFWSSLAQTILVVRGLN
jgi:hypothetical protein